MVKIRKGIFETNSSSTHSLSIGSLQPGNEKVDENYDCSITLGDGEYGWEQNDYYSWLDKADYITLLLRNYGDNSGEGNLDILSKVIHKKYPNVEINYDVTGYIDHGSEYYEAWMSTDEDKLFTFLFGDGTFSTDNDNY